jgi:hypothetical protein
MVPGKGLCRALLNAPVSRGGSLPAQKDAVSACAVFKKAQIYSIACKQPPDGVLKKLKTSVPRV